MAVTIQEQCLVCLRIISILMNPVLTIFHLWTIILHKWNIGEIENAETRHIRIVEL